MTILPLCPSSDPSQSDPDTRDFWFNMQALQLYLQREAEVNPQASYYNVGLLKYQVGVSNHQQFSAELRHFHTISDLAHQSHSVIRVPPKLFMTRCLLCAPRCHPRTRVGPPFCYQLSVSAAAR